MQNKAHAIMCHHFHDKDKHIVGQGSISAELFSDLLDYYGKDHNIIDAREFYERSEAGTLRENDVCLTFDDGLLCQYDVAYPVLRDRGLTAFWFIYTSPLCGVIEKLEIYRHFRFSTFKDIEEFYNAFFSCVGSYDPKAIDALNAFDPNEYLKAFPFYSDNDKRFRFVRDDVLGPKKYYMLMDRMLDTWHYDIENNAKLLWLNAEQIRQLNSEGHMIGLHTHTHPTVTARLDYPAQKQEYGRNKEELEKIIKEDVVSVSYPCHSYDSNTLKCMRELGIRIGFKANMEDFYKEELRYEYPREDHANILRRWGKKVAANGCYV